MASEHFRLFKDDILEISIYDLVDGTGARVNPSWFGSSRKKDLVVVATLFGIVGRALRRKMGTNFAVQVSSRWSEKN